MSDQLHVTHIVYRFATGGLENGIVNLINNLPAKRFRHSILCLQGYDPAFAKRLQREVPIESINKPPGPDWKHYLPMQRLLRRLRPDVVHTRNLASMEYQIAARLAGVRYRIHGEHGWDVADLDGSNRRYLWMKRLLKPLVHDFIALSDQSQRYLIEQVGVASRHCHKIINGVDTLRFHPSGAHAVPPDAQFLADNPLVFGCVGRLETVKNHRLLAQAFILLCQTEPLLAGRARLVIVGDGTHFATLQQLFADAGLQHQVWLAGEQANIPDFMRLFDIFVLPSLAEGISNTVLEALASGLPVIATDVGGNPELVEPGANGQLVPSDDVAALASAMGHYLRHPERRTEQGLNARARALADFSLQTMVDGYESVYSQAHRLQASA